jgi:hypothetical protein
MFSTRRRFAADLCGAASLFVDWRSAWAQPAPKTVVIGTDAILSIRRNVEGLNRTFGDRLQIVGGPVSTSNAYHI